MSVYACSDLHGMGQLWEQIKNFLQPEDKLIYLGDAADRGPDGWKMIKQLFNDSRVMYLKGNHEQMLADAIMEYGQYEGWIIKKLRLLSNNGGENTFNDWLADGSWFEWAHQLINLPTLYTYTNKSGNKLYLSHAGFTPWEGIEVFPGEDDLLWDRDHYLDNPNPNDMDGISIHGHTPQLYILEDLRLKEEERGALWYSNNHKICLDTAACHTGYTVLLDLDTFDEHIFDIYSC